MRKLFITFSYAILLGLWSCADRLEDLVIENDPETTSRTKSLDDAVYHESTNSDILPTTEKEADIAVIVLFINYYGNLMQSMLVGI